MYFLKALPLLLGPRDSRVDRRALAIIEAGGQGLALAFMILLILAAIMLAVGDQAAANILAEYAYYSLVGAVTLLLVSTSLEQRENEQRADTRASEEAAQKPGKEAALAGKAVKRYRLPSLRGRAWNTDRLARKRLLRLVSIGLFATGLASSLILTARPLGIVVLPGRPTILSVPLPHTLVSLSMFLEIIGLLASLFLINARSIVVLGIVAAILRDLGIASPFTGLAASSLYAYLSLMPRKYNYYVLLAPLLAASVLALPGTHSSLVAGIGWSIIASATITGLVLGFTASVTILATRVETRAAETRPGLAMRDKRLLASLLLLAGLSVLVVLSPHLRYRGKILSLDTVFNLKYCSLLASGDTMLYFTWMRPLYVLAACTPLLQLHIGLSGLKTWFDIVIPSIGLSALTITVLLILLYTGLTLIQAIIGAVIALSYWAPFFLYAGLQTNLLVLPAALLYALLVMTPGQQHTRRSLVVIALLSLFLGGWHPWTLAYYTAGLLIALIIYPRLLDAKAVSAALLPGWLLHAVIAAISRKSGVASVAKSAITLHKSFIWSLKVFMWGTSLRGEILLPLGALLLYMALGRKQLLNKALWALASTIPALLGIIMPMSDLYPRLLVDAPVPLLLVYMLAGNGDKDTKTILLVSLSALLVLVSLLLRLSPVHVPLPSR